jgi:adenosylhomocysteine nucleosidase
MLRNILIIAALPEEEAAVISEIGSKPVAELLVSEKLSVKARQYKIGSTLISVIQSGMGTVNAAVSCAVFSEKYEVGSILLLGVGGALRTDLRIGDLVVSSHVLQHDYQASLDSGFVRMKPGSFPITPEEQLTHEPRFTANPELVDIALTAGGHVGTIISGNEFVGTSERKQDLSKMDPNALLIEMEAAGVAQVAERLRVPFVVAKTVADRLFPDGTIENDFRTCLNAASKNAGKLVKNFISHIEKN